MSKKIIIGLVAVVALAAVGATGAVAVEVLSEEVTVDEGDSVTVDFEVTDEFNTTDNLQNTTIDVLLNDSTATTVNSSSVTVDASEIDSTGTIWKTVEFYPASNGTYNVSVDAADSTYINQTDVSVSGSGGLFGFSGDSSRMLIALLAVVVGGLYLYRDEL